MGNKYKHEYDVYLAKDKDSDLCVYGGEDRPVRRETGQYYIGESSMGKGKEIKIDSEHYPEINYDTGLVKAVIVPVDGYSVIKWNINNKPPIKGDYLVVFEYENKKKNVSVCSFSGANWLNIYTCNIVAWAELPRIDEKLNICSK